ncbi:MAG: FtsW/RodA/SpoVE family cell cycle protein, partial [Actinomycetales bacterium]|nr:FtsW/RodA/SpoVE family cell cycle protein [Actinomycetales bacterium]
MTGMITTSRSRRAAALAQLDWLLITSALMLSLIGSLLVWSATRQSLIDQGVNSAQFFWRQMLNVVIGVVLGFVLSRFDHRMLRAYTPIIYGLSIVGLLVVLTPLGVTVHGAQNWISLGPNVTVQP